MTQSNLFLREGIGNPRASSAAPAPVAVPRAWLIALLGVSSWMLLISLGWAVVAAWSIVHHAILG